MHTEIIPEQKTTARIIHLDVVPKRRQYLLEKAITFCEWKQVKSTTRANYISIITGFLSRTTEPLNWLMVQDYLNIISAEKSKSTAWIQSNVIKSFLEYLEVQCDIQNDGWRKVNIKKFHYTGGNKEFIEDKYFKDVYKMFDFSNMSDIRDYTVLKVLQSTGMRLSEPYNIRIKDIKKIHDSNANPVHIIDSIQKGGHRMVVKLQAGTLDAIKFYLSLRGAYDKDDYLFIEHKFKFRKLYKPLNSSVFYKKISQMFKNAGCENFTTHAIRYTAAIKTLEITGDEAMASRKLNHISPKTIQYYTKGYRENINAINDINIEIN